MYSELPDWYRNLEVDIPRINRCIVEKFTKPSIMNDTILIWYDKQDRLHSYNGYPSMIYFERRQSEAKVNYAMVEFYFHNHGKHIKTIVMKMEIKNKKLILKKLPKGKKFKKIK
jgi:hypothetical protein